MAAAGAFKSRGRRRETCVQRWSTIEARYGRKKSPRSAGIGAQWPGEGRENGSSSYLHGLDGLVGILHGAEIVVNGLVRQQQLVEDLQ